MRRLNQTEVKEILDLKREDVNMMLLKDFFAVKMGKKKPRFETFDKFTLPIKKLFNEKNEETTIGKYLFNFFVLPEKFLEEFGYQNVVLNKKTLDSLEKQLGNMLLNDKIDGKEYASYLDRAEWISLGTAYFLVPTMNYEINVPIPEVIKKRDDLFEKYNSGIKRGDSNVAETIEKTVLDMAKKAIKEKGNEAYDFFESGAFSFENNYKKTSIMAGAVENPFSRKLDILKSNYIDGIAKEEVPMFSNLTVIGGYSRGIETQGSGYETKKINNSMQTIILDVPGSDCKTPFFAEFILEDFEKGMYIDRYILESSGKLVLLTESNIKKYVGKKIKMRSPMFCKSEKICNKCAGELFYKMGIKNAGLLTSTFSGSLMNAAMKKFHDASIRFKEIKTEEFIKQED